MLQRQWRGTFVFFLTRVKTNARPRGDGGIRDSREREMFSASRLSLTALSGAGEELVLFRWIECWNADKHKILVLLS